LHLYTPSFSNLNTEQQREWANKVILAVNDDALPDLKNQARFMEVTVNENITGRKTESKEVVDGRSQTDTTKSKPKPATKSDRGTNVKKISSKNEAEKYAKEKLAPIAEYGKFWRANPKLAILKTHLKNQDFGAYQRIVDKRVEESSTEKKPIEVKAIVNFKEKIRPWTFYNLFYRS
jgi:hypothetical protein